MEAADLGRSGSGLLASRPGGTEDRGGRGGCGPQLTAVPFPEAEAMPASLSYEELVRRNVVGSGGVGRELGAPPKQKAIAPGPS